MSDFLVLTAVILFAEIKRKEKYHLLTIQNTLLNAIY